MGRKREIEGDILTSVPTPSLPCPSRSCSCCRVMIPRPAFERLSMPAAAAAVSIVQLRRSACWGGVGGCPREGNRGGEPLRPAARRIAGALFAANMFLGAYNSNSVQPVVSVERSVFYRERAAGMYSALPYSLAQVLPPPGEGRGRLSACTTEE